MSRIQQILDKAERDGAPMRTSGISVPSAAVAIPAPVTATVPITIDIPTPATPEDRAVRSIVPGARGAARRTQQRAGRQATRSRATTSA